MSLRLSSVRRSISRVRNQARARRRQRPWVVDGLETRVLLSGNPTYYTVNLTSDTGAGSGTDAITGNPSGDLLWAITQANANTNAAGSIIDFDPTVFATPQTIALSSTLVLSESAGPEVIQGPGASLVTISGNNAVGVIQVDSGATASLAGLTISGARRATAADRQRRTLSITDSTIAKNGANNRGGGIENRGFLTTTGTTITGNTANINGLSSNNGYGYGGGIDNPGTLTLIDSTVAGNGIAISGEGGGIDNSGTLTVTDSTIASNEICCSFTGNGGGIENTGTLTLTNSTIANNGTNGGGQGGGIDNSGTLTAVNTTIAYNVSGWAV